MECFFVPVIHAECGHVALQEPSMNMKRLYIPTIIALLFVASVATAGDKPTASSTSPDQRVLPVLVHVNTKGKVTDVAPAIKLHSGLQSLLEKTLDKMITKPAHDAKGKPIVSQFIIKLAMHTTQRDDGQLNVSFFPTFRQNPSRQAIGIGRMSVKTRNWYS